MIDFLVAILIAAIIVVGALFSLVAAIGLNRLPDLYAHPCSRRQARRPVSACRGGCLPPNSDSGDLRDSSPWPSSCSDCPRLGASACPRRPQGWLRLSPYHCRRHEQKPS